MDPLAYRIGAVTRQLDRNAPCPYCTSCVISASPHDCPHGIEVSCNSCGINAFIQFSDPTAVTEDAVLAHFAAAFNPEPTEHSEPA